MKLTAQEEYGLRCLIQVARRPEGSLVSIREVAEAEGLSLDYAAKLLRVLRQAELVVSERGASGGYRLARPARDITAAEILAALDTPLYSGAFCEGHAGQLSSCVHTPACSIRALWRAMSAAVDEVLQRVTLADLSRGEEPVRLSLQAADTQEASP